MVSQPTRVGQDAVFDYFEDDFTRHPMPARMSYVTDQPWMVTFTFEGNKVWTFERYVLIEGQRRSSTSRTRKPGPDGKMLVDVHGVNVRPGANSYVMLLTLTAMEESIELCMRTDEIQAFLRLCDQLAPEIDAEDVFTAILAHHGPCCCRANEYRPHSPVKHRACDRVPACGGCDSCVSDQLVMRDYTQRTGGAQ